MQVPAGRSDRWPSVLIERAFSEIQSKLSSDASWWLNASGGEVQTTLTISAQKSLPTVGGEKEIDLEHVLSRLDDFDS